MKTKKTDLLPKINWNNWEVMDDPIPILSDSEGLCSICEENHATMEIVYERVSHGVRKRFFECVCRVCFDDSEYLQGKKIISVKSI